MLVVGVPSGAHMNVSCNDAGGSAIAFGVVVVVVVVLEVVLAVLGVILVVAVLVVFI